MIQAVAELASPTGQWPEAIHPLTYGGCMGDGQHGWAASEWVMALRNLFVREEGDGLIVGSGLAQAWLETGEPLEFGPSLTPYGRITVNVLAESQSTVCVRILGDIDLEQTPVQAAVPGFEPQRMKRMDQKYRLIKARSAE